MMYALRRALRAVSTLISYLSYMTDCHIVFVILEECCSYIKRNSTNLAASIRMTIHIIYQCKK